MKKFIYVAVILLTICANALAQTTITIAKMVGTDSATVTFTKTTHDTLTCQFLLNTDTAGIGMPATVMYGMIDSTIGTFNKTFYLPSAPTWYVWIRIRDSSTHSWDTSNRRVIVGRPDLIPMLAPTLHGFNTGVMVNTMNDTVIVTHTLGYDTFFTTTYVHRTMTVCSIGGYMTYADSINFLPTGTHRWEKIKWHNIHGYYPDDSVVIPFTTGVPITLPYIHSYGALSSTDTSIDMPIVVNTYGGIGAYLVGYIRPTVGSTIWTDSVIIPLSGITGAQYPTVHFNSLLGATNYTIDARAVNSVGENWYGTTSYSTLVTPPSLPTFYVQDSLVTYDATTHVATFYVNYSNIVGYYCDLMMQVRHNGSVFATQPFSTLFGVGGVSYSWVLPDTGIYEFRAWGNEPMSGGAASYGTTLILHVVPPVVVLPVIELFQLDSLTYTFGALPQYMYRITGADVVKINGVTVPHSDTMSFMIPVLASDTLHLTATNSAGTIDSVLHIIVLDPSGVNDVKTKNMFTVYPNPAVNALIIKSDDWQNKTYLVQDVLGKIIAQIPATGLETTFSCDMLSAGMYYVRNLEGENIKFIKQ